MEGTGRTLPKSHVCPVFTEPDVFVLGPNRKIDAEVEEELRTLGYIE